MPNENELPDDFNVVTLPVGFDAFEQLHGEKKDNPGAAATTEDDDEEEGEKDKGKEKEKIKPAAAAKPIDLDEDLITAGLKKAQGNNNQAAPEKKKNDAEEEGEKDTRPFILSDEDKANTYMAHYKMMVAAGFWEEDEEFEKDGGEEKYLEVAENNRTREIHNELDNYFNEAFAKNPDGRAQGLKLFKHLQNGGTVSNFINVYAPAEFKFEELDSEEEEVAEAASTTLLKNYFSSIGWKKDKIDKRIKDLGASGRLVDEAKDMQEPYKELMEQQQKILDATTEKNNKNAKIERKKINDTLVSRIQKNEGFGEIPLFADKKEKQKFEEFFFVADEETNTTGFNQKFQEALKDPDFLLWAGTTLFHNLHKDPSKLAGDGKKKKNEAISSVRQTLEGVLLNKNLDAGKDVSDINSSNRSTKTGYQFNLEEAVVVS